jgi:hypothetical protein
MAGWALATKMPLLAALLLAAFPSSLAHHHDTSTAVMTKAPIYLPYYNDKAWSMVRGSIMSEVGLVGRLSPFSELLGY